MIPIAKPFIGNEEKNAILSVLESGQLAQGKKVEEFENEFAKYIGVKHAIATTNGTTALYLALLCTVKKGDEVITSPFTFVASTNTILMANAIPKFVDIDKRTFNISAEKIEKAITKKTKAILPIHLYGQSCEMDRIMEIAEKHNLIVIEDACQSHGSEFKGKKVGSFGVGTFSFYPTKNMTTGEGGMITTNDEQIAEKCRMLREHGSKNRYEYEFLGYNFRMTDISASIGIEQLKKLNNFNKKRIENAKFLNENLKKVEIPFVLENAKHVYHQYTIKVKNRDALKEKLAKEGIGSAVYYPKALHEYNFLKKFGNVNALKKSIHSSTKVDEKCFEKSIGPMRQPSKDGLHPSDKNLKNSEEVAKEVLSLPVHPLLSKEDLEKIVESVNRLG